MGNKIKILGVDDEPTSLLLLEKTLKKLDVDFYSTKSGKEAVALVKENDFALILLDVIMPEIDGFETSRRIRQLERGKFVPIIFLTGLSDQKDQIYKGYESGAVDYILKPIDKNILISKVNIFLELYEQKSIIEKQKEKLEEDNIKLKEAFERINFLHGFVKVCAKCRKLHSDDGDWSSFENYVSKYSDAKFSHGYCPTCFKEDMERLELVKKKRKAARE